ncbi:glycoside hydrolase family 75 protein [Pseudomonas sp. ATCC PTA-122608]|uniref:glycoside hydrolase family 75 protein n=1 Tax=Pseudomonas sp. ATCC PTA-122608 TaxID=1771311 RepID=UPI0009F9F783|nr:glycoside hydrolase family 75 protein [Pseudomonas sp. ATCC PTA-122608]
MPVITHPWKSSKDPNDPLPVVTVLGPKHVQILSNASTDTDGAPNAPDIDPTGQVETSLRLSNGWLGEGEYVNSLVIPYFVLPGNWKEVTGIPCYLGDIARLTYKTYTVYAIYADVGGVKRIGEASVCANQALGCDPWINGKVRVGIPYGVYYDIIPGSANLADTRTFDEIQAYGSSLFI